MKGPLHLQYPITIWMMEKEMIVVDTPAADHELFTEDDRTVFAPTGDVATLAETIKREKTSDVRVILLTCAYISCNKTICLV